MDAIIEGLAQVLEFVLPAPWNDYVSRSFLFIAILGVIYLVLRRIINRETVYIQALSTREEQRDLQGARIAHELLERIQYIQKVHSDAALTSASYASSIGSLKHINENIATTFTTRLIQATASVDVFTNIFSSVIDKLWPRIEVQGSISRQDGELRCTMRLLKGAKELDHWSLDESLDRTDAQARLLTKLAYQMIIDITNKKLIHGKFSIGTMSWKALQFHTDALSLWQDPVFHIEKPEHIMNVDSRLAESITEDPHYAMAYYNRGILQYLAHSSSTSNRIAIRLFEQAISILRTTPQMQDQARVSENRKIEGLALVGLSRCYCQERHRYGYLDEDIVRKARQIAQQAVDILGSDVKALHALAFSWHCTETLGDIREGRKYYEQITQRYPGKYPHIHNNLGYILMVGGKLVAQTGHEDEAETWYQQAQFHMEKVIQIEKHSSTRLLDFSNANLGNLFRLRRDYKRAIEYYKKALRLDPEHSTYTNGLNEYALVYFEMGDLEQGIHYHQRALSTTEDETHRRKLITQVLAVLQEIGNPAVPQLQQFYKSTEESTLLIDMWVEQLHRSLLAIGAEVDYRLQRQTQTSNSVSDKQNE